MFNSASVTAAGNCPAALPRTVASLPPTSPAATPKVSRPSSVAHLENVAAAQIALSDDEFDTLSALGEQNA